jgi:DNA-binding GntR family transcriptional regulator
MSIGSSRDFRSVSLCRRGERIFVRGTGVASRAHKETSPAGSGHDEGGSNGSAGRGLLKERAYAEIKKRILNNGFGGGAFLAERQLASELGMSKTPIRAALERLDLEGFVTISPQQGIIIRDLSVHDIADQYEIRAALETYVLRAVAGRLTRPQVQRLQANLEAQKANCSSCDVERGIALDQEFHILFCEFLGNREILRVLGQLRDKVHRVISQVFTINPGRMSDSYADHCAIAQAVIDGDGALAARRLEEHLELGKRCLLSPHRAGASDNQA